MDKLLRLTGRANAPSLSADAARAVVCALQILLAIPVLNTSTAGGQSRA